MSGKKIVKEPVVVHQFQTPDRESIDRTDHVWIELTGGPHCGKYKCCLCGGITKEPPRFPTPSRWLPPEWEPLTDEERELCPYP